MAFEILPIQATRPITVSAKEEYPRGAVGSPPEVTMSGTRPLMIAVMCAAVGTLLSAASSGPDKDLAAAIRTETEKVLPAAIEARRHFHAHPELSNREAETGREIARRLTALGLEPRTGIARTGVVAVLKGGRPGPVRVWRADIDALPIGETTGLPFASVCPSVMHACGHDLHTAVALGAAEVLTRLRERVPGTVVFLFQPAEEGAPAGEQGGAELVLAEGAIAEPRPAAIFGLHVEPELRAGIFGVRPGGIMAAADRFTIHVQGKASHGARPYEGIDAIYVAAQLVNGLQALVSREHDSRRPFVVTVGRLQAGSRFNIVAGEATLEGTVRTLDDDTFRTAPDAIERVVRGICQAFRATCTVNYERLNPVNSNAAFLARPAIAALVHEFGAEHVVEVLPQTVAEDFALYARLAPSFYFFLGVGRPDGSAGSIHSGNFNPDEAAITFGIRAAATLLTSAEPEPTEVRDVAPAPAAPNRR